MSGNTTGRLFCVTTFGESHGGAVGCVVDGCPPGLALDLEAVQHQMDRRRPGQSRLVSQRDEKDRVEVLSGLYEGRTLGTPLTMIIRNEDARADAYDDLRDLFRPSHADYTWWVKMGLRDHRGGGRASARETAARVMAGSVARQLLAERWGVRVRAWVDQVGEVRMDDGDLDHAWEEVEIDSSPVRCPDPVAAPRMAARIEEVRGEGDTIGGAIRCVVTGVPVGWGEPVFDKLEAALGQACLSLPAARAFELGSGFAATPMRGSEHNDEFVPDGAGGVRTRTNQSGGIQGGISNGSVIRVRVGFKPVATIFRPQVTVDMRGESAVVRPKGRHDPCVVPRAVPIVEAVVANVLVDAALRQAARGL